MAKTNILLESGTNEVEVLEFFLGDDYFGINVLKIRQIIKFEPENITRQQGDADPSILGSLIFHGQVIPIIDLAHFFSGEENEFPEEIFKGSSNALSRGPVSDYGKAINESVQDYQRKFRVVIVCEFNKQLSGFVVDGINKIHRITWTDIQSVSDMFTMEYVTGVAVIDGRQILVPDFEKIIANLLNIKAFDMGSMDEDEMKDVEKVLTGTAIRIFCVDDSSIVRQALKMAFDKFDFKNVTYFKDGQEAQDALQAMRDKEVAGLPVEGGVCQLLITDIEMPQVDGLTLCKRAKILFPKLPVIVISTLISEQMIKKCQSVGADAYVSKSELSQLMEEIKLISVRLAAA